MDKGLDYINEEVKICIAQTLFEQMHIELGCQVFRTAHEFLYPHIFDMSHVKRSMQHTVYKELNLEKSLKFIKSHASKALPNNPDYTVVTPAGNVYQFEVYYSEEGELNYKELKKFLDSNEPPKVFIFQRMKPFIRVLVPDYNTTQEEDDSLFEHVAAKIHGEVNENLKQYKKRYKRLSDEEVAKQVFEELIVSKGIELYEEEFYKKFRHKLRYLELTEDSFGNIVLEAPVEADNFSYPQKIVEKYAEILKKWMKR